MVEGFQLCKVRLYFNAGDEVRQAEMNAEGLPWYVEEEEKANKADVTTSSTIWMLSTLVFFQWLK